jgi:hypothetical protein
MGVLFGEAAPVVASISEGLFAAAEAEAALASALASGAASQAVPALVVGGTAGGAATTTATTIATANSWNPVGWIIGTVLVGASQCSPYVTWGCYKPIIGEAGNEVMSVEPITLATLAAHPKVQQISVGVCAASAGLPEVEVANTAGERYLLRGVVLPWGGAAYHAERISHEYFF